MKIKSFIVIIILFIIGVFIIVHILPIKKSESIENNYENFEFKTEKNYLDNYIIYDANGEVMYDNIEENNLKFYQDNPDYEPIDY